MTKMKPASSHIRYLRRIKTLKLFLGFAIALIIIYILRNSNYQQSDETNFFESSSIEYEVEPIDQPEVLKQTKKPAHRPTQKQQHQQYPPNFNKFFSNSHGCPNYLDYSQERDHPPFSKGPLELPFQRPAEKCRTFKSKAVEKLIDSFKQKLKDEDLARLFENALPNTLDTTILWHKRKSESVQYSNSFVVTGDIHAEWLRDAARQLSVYQELTPYDEDLKELIKGAINTQAYYILVNPYCNAFHPPKGTNVEKGKSAKDNVHPKVNWEQVFECKWEIDSLASFLTLTNEYYEATGDASVFNDYWVSAVENIILVLKRESTPTFNEDGNILPLFYSFQRQTQIGSETLNLGGRGNPLNYDINLIRSSFRPSDDATILPYFIPGNAHMATELKKTSEILASIQDKLVEMKLTRATGLIPKLTKYSELIKKSIYENAVINHPKFGKVFAYEIDGYGSTIFMDDANIPSLLSLPDLGFVELDDEVYQNTRKMVLNKSGNPYYLIGRHFKGIGGPHIGIQSAWPMSLLIQIRTSTDDDEILELLELIKSTTGGLGLIHESISVHYPNGVEFTRPWFAWANSEFGKTIIDLAKRKPHLIFKEEYLDEAFNYDFLKE